MLLTKIVDMKIKKISDFKQINEEPTVFVANYDDTQFYISEAQETIIASYRKDMS